MAQIVEDVLKLTKNASESGESLNFTLAKTDARFYSLIRKAFTRGYSSRQISEQLGQADDALGSLAARTGATSIRPIIEHVRKQIARHPTERLSQIAQSVVTRRDQMSGGMVNPAMANAFQAQATQVAKLMNKAATDVRLAFDNIGKTFNVFTVATKKINGQVSHMSAAVVEVDRATGQARRIVGAYSGQERAPRDTGSWRTTAAASHVSGIAGAPLRRLAEMSDIMVGRNVSQLAADISKIAPHSARPPGAAVSRLPQFDVGSLPWDVLGFNTRKVAGLARAHNMQPSGFTNSERSLYQLNHLLFSTHPDNQGAGPNYLGMMLGRRYPEPPADTPNNDIYSKIIKRDVRQAQGQFASKYALAALMAPAVESAWDYRNSAMGQLRESTRYQASNALVRGKRLMSGGKRPEYGYEWQGLGHTFSNTPAEATPGDLPDKTILGLDRQKRVAERFIRNAYLLPPDKLYDAYRHASTLIDSRGLEHGNRSGKLARGGQDMHLEAMDLVNQQANLWRAQPEWGADVTTSTWSRSNRWLGTTEAQSNKWQKRAEMNRHVGWFTRGGTGPQADSDAIRDFIKANRSNTGPGLHVQAAQMAAQVGESSALYTPLTRIMEASRLASYKQKQGRLLAASTVGAMSDTSASEAYPSFASRMRSRFGAGTGSQRGSAPYDFLNPLSGIGSRIRSWFGSRHNVTGGGVDYDAMAADPNFVLPEATTLRGSIGKAALDRKLAKLASTLDQATQSFEKLRDSTIPTTRARQESALGVRSTGLDLWRTRRGADIQSRYNTTYGNLGKKAFDAEESLQLAEDATLARLYTSKGYKKIKDPIRQYKVQEAVLQNMPVKARLRAIRADYAYRSAGLIDPEEVSKLQGVYADRLVEARFISGRARPGEAQAYRSQLLNYGVLSGMTPAQEKARAEGRLGADFNVKQAAINAKRDEQQAAAWEKRTAAEEKLGRLKSTTEQQKVGLKSDYLKKAAIAAEGGAGGGGGGRRGVLASLFTGSRGGGGSMQSMYGWGMSAAALAGVDSELRNIIKDSAVYAARTQMMEFATRRMAEAAGLSTDKVDEQVSSLKNLNITTQAAHSVVQKLMMVQVDLSKSTGLVHVAQDLAAVSGSDAMETIQRLMSAVVTGYTRQLHMMGLQVTSAQVMHDLRIKRKAAGQKGEPTPSEIRNAMVDRIMSEDAKFSGTYERSMLTAGGQYAYLGKEVQETKNVLGRQYLPVMSRVMQMARGGLSYIREHPEGSADAISGLTAAGAGLGTAATLQLGGLMLGVAPPVALTVGAAALVSGGAYALLSQDRTKATMSVGNEQIARMASERRSIMGAASGGKTTLTEGSVVVQNGRVWESRGGKLVGGVDQHTVEGQNALGYAANERESRRDQLDSIAEDYNRRKDAAAGFRRGFAPGASWQRRAASAFTGAWAILRGPLWGGVGDLARQGSLSDVQDMAVKTGGVFSQQDIVSRSAELAASASYRQNPNENLGLVNASARDAAIFASVFQQAQQTAVALEEKYNPMTSGATKRAMRLPGAPLENLISSYNIDMAQIDDAETQGQGLMKKALDIVKPGDWDTLKAADVITPQTDKNKGAFNPTLVQFVRDMAATGIPTTGTIGEMRTIFEDKLKGFKGTRENRREELALAKESLRRQGLQKLTSIRVSSAIDQLRPLAVTNSDQEQSNMAMMEYYYTMAGAQKNFRVRSEGMGLSTDEELQAESSAAAAKYRSDAITSPLTARNQARYSALMSAGSFASEQMARLAMSAPGQSGAAGLQGAYDARLAFINTLPAEKDRIDATQKLNEQFLDSQRQYAEDQIRDAASAGLDVFTSGVSARADASGLAMRGVSDHTRALMGIAMQSASARTNVRQGAIVQIGMLPDTASSETWGSRLDSVGKATNAKLKQIDVQQALDKVKEAANFREVQERRLITLYGSEYDELSKIAQLKAVTTAESAAADYNNYQERLKYIDKEAKARDASGTNEDVKQEAAEQKRQANAAYLQTMLARQQEDAQSVRGAAGDVIDIVTRRSYNKTHQLKDLGITMMRDTAKQIGGNIAAEVWKLTGPTLDKIIRVVLPQGPQGHPNWLGRIVGGTHLEDKHLDEIAAMEKTAAGERKIAEQKGQASLNDATTELDATKKSLDALDTDTKALDTDLRRLLNWLGMSAVGSVAAGVGNIFSNSGSILSNGGFLGRMLQTGGAASGNSIMGVSPQARVSSSISYGDIVPTSSPSSMYTALPMLGGFLGQIMQAGKVGGTPPAAYMFDSGTSSSSGDGGSVDNTAYSALPGVGGSVGNWPGTDIPQSPADTSTPIQYPDGSTAPVTGGSPGSTGSGPIGATQGALGQAARFLGTHGKQLGNGLVAAGGAMQAYSGFKHGGAKGDLSGAAGVLMTGAGIAAMFGPAGFAVAAGLAIAAGATDLISALVGNSPQKRQEQIANYMTSWKFNAPTQASVLSSTNGMQLAYSARTGMAATTPYAAYPVALQQTQYGQTPSKTWSNPNVPEWYTIPGRQSPNYPTYGPGNYPATSPSTVSPGAIPTSGVGGTNNYYSVNVPVHAIDSKDLMARSGDFARAIKKELYSGSDLSLGIQNAIFGPA
jgi:hypothetical protein